MSKNSQIQMGNGLAPAVKLSAAEQAALAELPAGADFDAIGAAVPSLRPLLDGIKNFAGALSASVDFEFANQVTQRAVSDQRQVNPKAVGEVSDALAEMIDQSTRDKNYIYVLEAGIGFFTRNHHRQLIVERTQLGWDVRDYTLNKGDDLSHGRDPARLKTWTIAASQTHELIDVLRSSVDEFPKGFGTVSLADALVQLHRMEKAFVDGK